jgi:glyoxylase-like metal-dependent hydrolase (beta-lactamase superfamily II)
MEADNIQGKDGIMTRDMSRIRETCATIVAVCVLFGLADKVRAEAPMVKTQAPGYYRMMLGKFEVTALFDGGVNLDAALLRNISESDIQKLLAHGLIENSHKIPASINAYLINTGAKLVLVDAGGGAAMGPAAGFVRQNLKAAGYSPEQVDFVLITHLHPDHVAGLLDATGKPALPKAEVYVAKAESDYWLSTAKPESVPAEYREHLKKAVKLVQTVADPYLKSGRWKTFEGVDLPISGVKAVPIVGHTPGHTGYEVSSDGHTLLIIGDTIHIEAVQFARPDAAVSFDSDPKQAVAAREALFRRIADGKTLVAGMHLSFPGIGRIRADGEDHYGWAPISYAPVDKPDATTSDHSTKEE